jgi:CheY-like chemotaxis protein
MNLITNASEAIGERDGVIRVTTSGVRLGWNGPETKGLLRNGEYVQLEISDTGSGIPLEMQPHVFDPFFTTKSSGHGLGLSIVDGIVRSLGGAIQLTSNVGNGTTFLILLPCAQITAAATSAMSPIDEIVRSDSNATVLVVEDEPPLRLAVTKMLRQIGYEVFEAADGTTAIDLLHGKGRQINAILLDITIPGASSTQVVAEASKTRPEIRVILTSAYSQDMLKGSMSAPQVRSFIRKPFQFGDLAKALQNALST